MNDFILSVLTYLIILQNGRKSYQMHQNIFNWTMRKNHIYRLVAGQNYPKIQRLVRTSIPKNSKEFIIIDNLPREIDWRNSYKHVNIAISWKWQGKWKDNGQKKNLTHNDQLSIHHEIGTNPYWRYVCFFFNHNCSASCSWSTVCFKCRKFQHSMMLKSYTICIWTTKPQDFFQMYISSGILS